MSSESKVTDAINAAKGLVEAVPIYPDAIQPAAKELGKGLTTLAKCVNMVLAPLTVTVWGYEQFQKFVEESVSRRLKNVPQERITSPKAEIAGPAIEALRFRHADPDLRELFASLLATSIDSQTATQAHPAFVEIIKCLSSDEAKLLAYFRDACPIPAVELLVGSEDKPKEGFVMSRNGIDLPENVAILNRHLIGGYIDNLCRLGLIEIDYLRPLAAPNAYAAIENDPSLSSIRENLKAKGQHLRFRHGTLFMTDWGKSFSTACLQPAPLITSG